MPIDAPTPVTAPVIERAAPAVAPDDGARPYVASIDPAGLPVERYRALLQRFRDAIDDRIPSSGYRIEVLDRTAPDLAAEGRKAFEKNPAYARWLADPAEGAFYQPRRTADGPACAIVGFAPGYDVRGRLARPVRGGRVETGTLDVETFHWFALMHELGHCLLGDSEARAETFAALMGLHEERVSRDELGVLARYREADEWTNPDAADDHFVSAPVWEVLRRAPALKADPAFMALSVEKVASLARSVADRYAPGRMGVLESQAVRRSLAEASRSDMYAEAPDPTAAFRGWVKAHVDVPVLARYDGALSALEAGGGVPPRWTLDLNGFRDAMIRLALTGDRTAAKVLAALRYPDAAESAVPDFADDIPLARRPSGFDWDVVAVDAP